MVYTMFVVMNIVQKEPIILGYTQVSNGFIFLYSQPPHVDNPLASGARVTDKVRACAVYIESYCHEFGIHIKKYQQRRVFGKQEYIAKFNDNLIVAEIPKKDGVEDIFDQITWTVYIDIHYLRYNNILDHNDDDVYVDIE